MRTLGKDLGRYGFLCFLGIVLLYVLLVGLAGGNPFRRPAFPAAISTPSLYLEVAKVALGLAAAVGAVLALTVGYRRHLLETAQSHRDDERLLIERFQSAAKLVGDEKAAVRLSGVYAMAQLADDWEREKQTCIDVLCAYARMPYDRTAPDAASEGEVRRTVFRVIVTRLKESGTWRGYDFDFTGAEIEKADFSSCDFSNGTILFVHAKFVEGVAFSQTQFSGAFVNFFGAQFHAGAWFNDAKFSGSTVMFSATGINGGQIDFSGARFSGGRVTFQGQVIDGGSYNFSSARFEGCQVQFNQASMGDGRLIFDGCQISECMIVFALVHFAGGSITFHNAHLSGGQLILTEAKFSGTMIDFRDARLTGTTVQFCGSEYDGGLIDFEHVQDFSVPPLDLPAPPSPYVKLPNEPS